MNGSSMCLRSAPTDIPSRMPSPSSYVEPSVMSFAPSAGVYSAGVYAATISGFITKPPAAITVAPARTTPVSSKERQASPTTAPDSSVTRLAAPVSYLTSTPASSTRSRSRSMTSLAAPGVPGHRDLVPARRRLGLIPERPHLLVAGEHQPLGARLDHGLAGEVGALELEAQRLQPAEVLNRPLAVGADLVVLGLLRRRDQVLVHLFRGVLVTGRLLHRGAPAEVEMPARPCRSSHRARRPARAAAPGRPPGPPPGPRCRRRCRSR